MRRIQATPELKAWLKASFPELAEIEHHSIEDEKKFQDELDHFHYQHGELADSEIHALYRYLTKDRKQLRHPSEPPVIPDHRDVLYRLEKWLVILIGLIAFLLLFAVKGHSQGLPPAKITSDGTCTTAPLDFPTSGPAYLAVNSTDQLCAGVSVSATIATAGLAISVNAGSASTVGTPIYFRDTNGVYQPAQLDGAGVGNNLKVNCSNCSAAAGATVAAPGATVASSGTTASEAVSINYIWNPNTTQWERVQGAAVGDAATSTGLFTTALMGFNGSTFDRLRSSNYGTSPGANPALGVNAFITNSPSVTITGQPINVNWLTSTPGFNVVQWGGVNLGLGAIVNYGSTPAAVAVPGVNAFITNTPAVTISGQPVNVNFLTSNIAENLVQLNGTTISTASYNGGAAVVIGFQTANIAVNLAQVAGTATVTGGVNGSQGVGGLAASGAAAAGNPVLVAALSGTNAQSMSMNITDSGVNVHVVNTPAVTISGQPVNVNFLTSNIAENITQFGSVAVIAAFTSGLITTAGGVVEVTQPSGLAANTYRALSMTAAAAVRVATGSDVFNATVVGNLTNNNAAATGNRVGTLPCIAQSQIQAAATAGRDLAPVCDLQQNLSVSLMPRGITTYAASGSGTLSSNATDIAVLPGNATNTVIVVGVTASCTQTTAGINNIMLIKRSAADSGGSSSAMTLIPLDSGNAGGVSAPLFYTGNPTLGASVGVVDQDLIGLMAPATASPNDIYVWPKGPLAYGQTVVLRGTAQQLAVNFGGSSPTGAKCDVNYKWIETTGL